MTVLDFVREFWAVLAALGTWAVGWIVWMVRLEAKALGNEREIKRLWLQRKEDLARAEQARKESNDMLAEIRIDVKQLLGRTKD